MFKINEQLECAIFLNGTEIPLSIGNFIQSIHIASGTGLKLPVLTLRLVDSMLILEKLGLQDGSKIKISLNGLFNQDREFRVSSFNRVPAGDGFAYTLHCYWDSPKYWAGTTSKGIRGSSHDVLSKIASECGLKFSDKNTKTADSMLWLPSNQTFSEFAKDIARYGYNSPTSHMVYGVDSMGVVRYRDVNANPKPKIKAGPIPTEGDSSFLQTLDFEPVAKSGMNNIIAGYSHSRYVQSGNEATDILNLEEILEYKADCDKPLFNKDLRSLISRGGVSYSPIDFGNVHDKYERAKYQNTRFDLLNNLTGQMLVGFQTPLEMCDNLKYVAPAKLGPITYDGEYTIKSKIIYIAGTSYYEKLIAVKNGLEA